MQNLTGQTIKSYHILEQVGEGGMAVVYKAYDTRLDCDVAVKIIRKNAFAPDAAEIMLKRFDREAKTLANLNHPNIIPIIDYDDYMESPYIVMPFIQGGTLQDKMDHVFSTQDAVSLLLPIAQALAYAHSKNIIHRDVKLSNILITETGNTL